MAIVQAKNEKPAEAAPEFRLDEKLMSPGKYEVTPEHTFVVEVHLKQQEGRWVIARSAGKGIDSHKVVFRLWNYDEMIDLKKKTTTYDPQKRIHTIDQDGLNRMKIQKLMVSWTFGDDNPRLKIHRVQDVLTDESWANFKRLQTNIITYITDRMNEVLDYNG